jgi:hypothetical protein
MSTAKLKRGEQKSLSVYVEQLKLLIMDEIYFLFSHEHNAKEIIAKWFELNDRSSLKDWIVLDRCSLERIWHLMKTEAKLGD